MNSSFQSHRNRLKDAILLTVGVSNIQSDRAIRIYLVRSAMNAFSKWIQSIIRAQMVQNGGINSGATGENSYNTRQFRNEGYSDQHPLRREAASILSVSRPPTRTGG